MIDHNKIIKFKKYIYKTWNTKEGSAMDNWIGMTMAPEANHNHTSEAMIRSDSILNLRRYVQDRIRIIFDV